MTFGQRASLDPPVNVEFLDILVADIGFEECIRILGMFKENLREYCEKMRKEIEAGEMINIKRVAHGLKGLCMQFGATHSIEIAKMIEMKVGSAEEAKEALDRLVKEIERVEVFVDSWSRKEGQLP